MTSSTLGLVLIFGLLGLPSIGKAGDWRRVSPDTLEFSGPIEETELANFQRVFDAGIRRIRVDSGGGNTIAGFRIGQILVQSNIEVEVRGICMSACANYIFGSAKKRNIAAGVVGFHGNMRSFVHRASATFANVPREVGAALLKLQIGDQSLTDAEAWAWFDNYKTIAEAEDQFFLNLGISQALFDRSARDDKGMNDGKTYSMLLPTPVTFEKYGFKGVDGVQSQLVLQTDPRILSQARAGWPVLID